VQLSFALAGVRTPLRAQQASAGRPATQDEPHCHEALALTRRLVLQRDVELDVRRPRPRAPAAPGGGLQGPAWGALPALRLSARSGSTAPPPPSALLPHTRGRLRMAVHCMRPCNPGAFDTLAGHSQLPA